MLQELISSFENLRFHSGASTRSLVSAYDFVWEHQPGVSYLPTISFRSINPKSRILLRFCLGASTRSLVSSHDSVLEHQPRVSYFFYDSVRECQLRVSYLPTISFGSLVLFLRFHSRNVTIFRIKVSEENSKKNSKKEKEKNPKNRKKKFSFSSPGQNVRLFSLPYS